MQLFGNKKGGKHSGAPAKKTETKKAEPETEVMEESIPESAETAPAAQQTSSAAEEIIMERKQKKAKKKKAKTILIIIAVIIALIVAVIAAIIVFSKPPETNNGGIKTNNGEAIEVDHKAGVYTFLVTGVDQISDNTDTIMVGSFDTENHKLSVVSIPRDTLTNIPHEVKKANSVYHYAKYYSTQSNSSYYGKDPVDCMREGLIENLFGYNVDSYVVVNLDACADVIDAIGGVDFDVPIDMNYDSKHQDLHIHIKAGPQKLSGEDFVKIMRFRSGYANADLGRIDTQQKLLKALAKEMISLGNIPNLNSALKIIKNNMETNLSFDNMVYFATEFLKMDFDNINFMTLPQAGTGSLFGLSYVFVDIDAWLEMLNENFNPYEQEITTDNVNIVTYSNGTFYSTSGKLAGGVGSFYGNSGSSMPVVKYGK